MALCRVQTAAGRQGISRQSRPTERCETPLIAAKSRANPARFADALTLVPITRITASHWL